jgi:hypothetical protein
MKNLLYLTPRVDISERILNACFMGRNTKWTWGLTTIRRLAFLAAFDTERDIRLLLRLKHHFSAQKGQFASQVLQLVWRDGIQVLVPYGDVRVLPGFQRASTFLKE